MNRRTIPISGAHPAPHRPQYLSLGGCGAGQRRRQPASAASGTLDAPALSEIIIGAMGDLRILRSATPPAVTFTLNQNSRRVLNRGQPRVEVVLAKGRKVVMMNRPFPGT